MTGLWNPFGEPGFGLDDGKLAPNNLDGTFGTLLDIPSIQLMDVKWNMTTAELKGDDGTTDTQSRRDSADLTFRFGGMSFEVSNAIMGSLIASVGTTPNQKRTLYETNRAFVYFGIAGRAIATRANGMILMFAPMCKVTDAGSVKFEQGGYTIPEFKCRAQRDPNFVDTEGYELIIAYKEYETITAIALPPS